MAKFFKNFAKIPYDFKNKNNVIESLALVDITLRTRIIESMLSNATAFYPYFWKDSDRPDIIADKYYGSHEYWWAVFFSNSSFDLYYDFPLPQKEFDDYIKNKYAVPAEENEYANGMIYAQAEIIHTKDENNNIIVNGPSSNASLVTTETYSPVGLVEVTYYDHEFALNEKKRHIKLLDNDLLTDFVNEFESLMSTTKRSRL